ncbi:MAG TPA: fibronectin type III domain-containing protein [Bacteroidia bacterium]|nr:fibronectin type III domain-containing protein [Bacteroidia bacterium]
MSIAVLKLNKKPVSVIVETVRKVVTMMTGNLAFTTPNPPLASITALVDALDTLDQETQQGGEVKNALKKLTRSKLLAAMSALTGYVQTTSLGDEDQILSAGFELKRKPVKLGMLVPPGNFRGAFGLHPGEIILRWAGVYGRTEYFAEMSTDPTNPALWTNVPNGHTGRVRLVVSGLTPGQVYYFRVFTECTAGTSGPSEIANHMAA